MKENIGSDRGQNHCYLLQFLSSRTHVNIQKCVDILVNGQRDYMMYFNLIHEPHVNITNQRSLGAFYCAVDLHLLEFI